jgi:SAM-dependent methyltransferase
LNQKPARDPTRRFSDRVAYYVRYRPGYPAELIEFLRNELKLEPSDVVADVGSGTGKLSELFLQAGNAVYGIEPNAEMRAAAEQALRDRPNFHSIAGSAEATGLADASVSIVAAAQAFHWFRIDETRREFQRILRPAGWAVLIWNRRIERTSFLRAYEELLQRLSLDYASVDHRKTTATGALGEFFGRDDYPRTTFPNRQTLDWDGLRGRSLSSSYVPLPGQPEHEPLMTELRRVFDEHQTDGVVRIEYETEVYWSHV